MEYWNNVLLEFSKILCKIPPNLPLPKGGDRASPFVIIFLPEAGKRGIKGDFEIVQ